MKPNSVSQCKLTTQSDQYVYKTLRLFIGTGHKRTWLITQEEQH